MSYSTSEKARAANRLWRTGPAGIAYLEAHREEMRAKHAAWYAEHREAQRAKQRERNHANRAANLEGERKRVREGGRLHRYGITPAAFDALLAEQGGLCAICRTDNPGARIASFCVDHDHETGAVRGLLCDRCNVMLSRARDSIEVLVNAAEYIRAAL
jgi:hypothetical protein